MLALTLCLERGMALQAIMHDDPTQLDGLLEAWKRVLPVLIREHSTAVSVSAGAGSP